MRLERFESRRVLLGVDTRRRRGWRRPLRMAAAVPLLTTLMLVGSLAPVSFAAGATATQIIGTVDPVTCAAINLELRTHPETVPTELRSAIPGLTDLGCRLVVETVSRSPLSLGPASAAAATTCTYTHKMLHLYSGPIETYTAHDEAYVCWNGTQAWQQDYHYCYVTSYPLGFGGSDSCIVINNHTATITLRNNFWVSAYSLPTYKRFGWMSYTVSKSGGISGVSGSCCS